MPDKIRVVLAGCDTQKNVQQMQRLLDEYGMVIEWHRPSGGDMPNADLLVIAKTFCGHSSTGKMKDAATRQGIPVITLSHRASDARRILEMHGYEKLAEQAEQETDMEVLKDASQIKKEAVEMLLEKPWMGIAEIVGILMVSGSEATAGIRGARDSFGINDRRGAHEIRLDLYRLMKRATGDMSDALPALPDPWVWISEPPKFPQAPVAIEPEPEATAVLVTPKTDVRPFITEAQITPRSEISDTDTPTSLEEHWKAALRTLKASARKCNVLNAMISIDGNGDLEVHGTRITVVTETFKL